MNRILFSFVLFSFFMGGMAEASNWVRLRETNTGTAYYDSETVHKSENRVTMVVKFAYTPEGEKEFKEAFHEIPESQKIACTLYAYEIDCSSRAFRILSAATYDASGLVIKGTKMERTESEPEMEHITPKSILEQLFYGTCP